MRTLIIALIIVIFLNTLVYSQSNNKDITPSSKNWAVGMMYTENGFGLFGTYSKRIGRITSATFKLSMSGVSDPNEVEYFDYYTGESFIRGKINRVYASSLSIGLMHNIFFDDIEGNFKPFVKGGIAPTLIMTTPYERSFFKAFGYTQTSFGLGVYGGIGIDYYQSRSLGMSLGIEYYYIPVLGREVSSIIDRNITNVGGLQFSFNLMFF